MNDTTETYRIVMMIEGEDKAKKLAADVAAAEKNIKALKDSFAQGNVTAAVYNKELASLTAAKAKLNREIENAVKSYQRLQTVQASTNAAASGGVDAFTKYGSVLSQIGYIADDAQYGIRGLINNIQPLAAALGVGTGIAGAIGLVTVAAAQLYQHWDQIAKLWDGGASERETKRLKELKDSAEAYKKVIGEIAKMVGSDAEGQRSVASKAIRDVGGTVALKEAMAAIAEEDKKTPFRSTQPLKERAQALLANAEKGWNGGPQFLESLFGPGTKRSDNTALGRAFQNAAGAGVPFYSPEEEKKRQRDAMIERGRIENEKEAADAAKLKATTLAWMEDENRVGMNRERHAGREIQEDIQGQRGRARAQAQEFRDVGGFDMVKQAMIAVAQRGGNAGQVMAKGTKMFLDQGMSIEEADKAARDLMRSRVNPEDDPRAAAMNRIKELMGPREIIQGASSLKDRIMTSGGLNDPATKQLQEAQKSRTLLESIDQSLRLRTFPAIVN